MHQKGFLNIIIAVMVGAVIVFGVTYVIIKRLGQPTESEPKLVQWPPAEQSPQDHGLTPKS